MSLYPVGRTVQTEGSQRPLSSYISSQKELVQVKVPAVVPSGNAVDPALSHTPLSLSLSLSPLQLNFTGEVTTAHIFLALQCGSLAWELHYLDKWLVSNFVIMSSV